MDFLDRTTKTSWANHRTIRTAQATLGYILPMGMIEIRSQLFGDSLCIHLFGDLLPGILPGLFRKFDFGRVGLADGKRLENMPPKVAPDLDEETGVDFGERDIETGRGFGTFPIELQKQVEAACPH